jgi:hypothetical protein
MGSWGETHVPEAGHGDPGWWLERILEVCSNDKAKYRVPLVGLSAPRTKHGGPSATAAKAPTSLRMTGFSLRYVFADFVLGAGAVGGLAFLHVVAVPLGDFDHVGAGLFDDGLAAEAAVELDVRRGLHAVELEVFGLAEARCTLFHVDVAGCTGADASAGVVEEDVVVLGDVEEAHGQAVALVGEAVEGELDGAALGEKGDADHAFGGWLGEVNGCFGL